MGRRRSTSSTTRIVQVLFALVWIGFLVYMVMGYMKKPAIETVADGADVVEGIGTVSSETPTPGPVTLTHSAPGTSTLKSTSSPASNNAGPTARKILETTLAAYRDASSYSDKGQLKVEFRIDGHGATREEYPWSTAWTNDGKMQLNVFDAKVRSDGNLLSCFVSEIRTENLKNQQLFLKGTQLIQQLYRDRIASYYLNGGERIPVNEKIVPNSQLLVPPALSLLTGESKSPWLNASTQPERLKDSPVEGKDCYVIRCPSQSGQLVAWIDKTTSLIRQVKLPNALLDPSLSNDPKVRDLKFFAQFKGASFDANSVAFGRIAPAPGTWPVREFVAPADPLPTNLLGQMPPEFTLLDEKRKRITDRQLQGKPMALLFVDGGDSDAALIEKFDALKDNLASSRFDFVVVAGPRSVETGANGSWRLSPAIQPAANKTKVPFLADLDGSVVKSMELASLPAVITMNNRLNIQYADLLSKPAGYNGKLAISDKWDQRLTGAITAQAKGLDVAGDMRDKYRGYLDKYFSDRDQRLATNWFPGFALPNQQKVAAVPVNVRREQNVKRSDLKLNPRLVWESTKLTSPGNVAIVPDSNRRAKGLLVMDGWQTVCLFSVEGKPISRKRLNLPDEVAVTSIRSLVSANGKQQFAMFAVGGEQVYIFDGSMELLGKFPESKQGRNSILACEVLPGSGTQNDQLLVCFGGSGGAKAFDAFSGTTRSIGDSAVRALALSGRSVLAADERSGALLSMDNGRVIDDRREYSHVKSGAVSPSAFAATAMNSNREWSVVLLDEALKVKRTFPISSAVFGNGLEPISGVASDGKGLWAVADNTNRIYLLSGDGVWLGDMAADGKVSGLKLMTVDGRDRLVVSTDRKVECWELNFAPDRVGSVNGRRE